MKKNIFRVRLARRRRGAPRRAAVRVARPATFHKYVALGDSLTAGVAGRLPRRSAIS